jgi:hypothetical protein
MRAIYVPLSLTAKEALVELAEREFREPQDQAALLLTDALRRVGALNDTDSRAIELVAA